MTGWAAKKKKHFNLEIIESRNYTFIYFYHLTAAIGTLVFLRCGYHSMNVQAGV